jgi:hypothetical protein
MQDEVANKKYHQSLKRTEMGIKYEASGKIYLE